jgi:hypothetical protein
MAFVIFPLQSQLGMATARPRKRVWKWMIDYTPDEPCKDDDNEPKCVVAPCAYNPRHYFVQYLARFQAKEQFSMITLCDTPMNAQTENEAETALLNELHSIVVREYDVWASGNIKPWMVKHAIKRMRVKQQTNAYAGHSWLAKLKVNGLHDHVMLLWSKLAERAPPSFTPGQERFILSTYERMQEEAKKLGFQNLFPASYMLHKICQTLSFHTICPVQITIKCKWAERYDEHMEPVFQALGREWLPTTNSSK